MARQFGQRTSDFSRDQLDRQVRAAIGVPYTSIEKPTRDRVEEWTAQNVDLIQTVPDRYFDRLRSDIEEAYADGTTADELADRFADVYDISLNDARRIARDQIGKLNGEINQDRQESLGVERFIWRTMNDNRVRETHRDLEGQNFAWDDPPIDEDGEEIIPGSPINCVPADAPVLLHAPAVKAYRRFYHGELTEFISGAGPALRCTPNHPVLTMRGWLAAHLVEVGDYLVEAPGQRGALTIDNPQRRDPNAEQVFGALCEIGIAHRIVTGAMGFHGDAVHEQVDIVDVDWRLFFDRVTALAQRSGDDALAFAAQSTATLRAKPEFIVRAASAAHRSMSRLGESGPAIGGSGGHADEHRLAAVAWAHALAEEHAADGATVAAMMISERLLADPGAVRRHDFLFRKVEAVVRRPWSGTVYNFETVTGWFSSHGRIVHNCRCFAEPDLSDLVGDVDAGDTGGESIGEASADAAA